jgi:hypothetical protein
MMRNAAASGFIAEDDNEVGHVLLDAFGHMNEGFVCSAHSIREQGNVHGSAESVLLILPGGLLLDSTAVRNRIVRQL